MKAFWQRVVLGCIVLLLSQGLMAQANTCNCDSTTTWEEHVEAANVIFLGTCMDATPNAIKGGMNVLFQVDSSWKRAIEPVTTVHTKPGPQCGYDFVKGKRYIVWATKRHQTIATSSCEPNQAWEENGMLTVRRLGAGFGPGRADLSSRMNLLLLALGVGGLVFLAFVVLRKRFTRKRPA